MKTLRVLLQCKNKIESMIVLQLMAREWAKGPFNLNLNICNNKFQYWISKQPNKKPQKYYFAFIIYINLQGPGQ